MNLVGNALKFTRDGSVAIEVERLTGANLVEFRVADTGVGIAPENLSRIFEEFVTIDTSFDRETSGTGLGLAITKRLIERDGGKLEADSLLGEGSLFTFRLPLPPSESVTGHTPKNDAHPLPHLPQGFQALIVDDNDINREILVDIVRELGGRSQEASDGYDAIDACSFVDFDVLLLDISMPGIDGIETLKRIRREAERNASTPTIAVTAHASPTDHEAILAHDFQSLVLKPVRRVVIHETLAQAFGMLGESPIQASARREEPEFLKRFGLERYTEALAEARYEILQFLNSVDASDLLPASDRAEAHRLSGSAAVLGEVGLWGALQAVQNAPSDNWRSHLAHLQIEFERVFPERNSQA